MEDDADSEPEQGSTDDEAATEDEVDDISAGVDAATDELFFVDNGGDVDELNRQLRDLIQQQPRQGKAVKAEQVDAESGTEDGHDQFGDDQDNGAVSSLSNMISDELHTQHQSNKAELITSEPPEIQVKEEPIQEEDQILASVSTSKKSKRKSVASAAERSEPVQPSLPPDTPSKRPKRGSEAAEEPSAADAAPATLRRSSRKPARGGQ